MRPKRSKTELIVWHCSATPPSRDIGAADINIMHKARGWNGIGYHVVIKRDGVVQLGEDMSSWGAHAKDYNSISVAVALVGGVSESGKSENNFTVAQWASAKSVFEFLTLLYPDARHYGHRDFSCDKNGDGKLLRWEFVKDCPCYSVKQWIENGLMPVADLYAPWETDTSVEVPEEKEHTQKKRKPKKRALKKKTKTKVSSLTVTEEADAYDADLLSGVTTTNEDLGEVTLTDGEDDEQSS